MYPKVKVRVQRDEDDQYAYEKISLESLKAFEWLSLHHSSSSDESPVSVVRVPRVHAPKSPAPAFVTSKDTNKKKAVVGENRKNVRPASAPRPRAVLSSPDNDVLIVSKTQTRGKQNQRSSQSRHGQCKIFPKSSSPESFKLATQGHHKVSAEPNNNLQSRGRTVIQWKKMAPRSP